MHTKNKTMLLWTLSLLLALPAWAADVDGDGADDTIDCDDNDPFRSPNFTDDDCNNIDDDCDGDTDPLCPCATRFGYDGMYLICEEEMTWQEHQDNCTDLGSNLATLGSLEESNWIQRQTENVREQSYWFGLNDLETEGVFVWVDGSDETYRKWGSPPVDNDDDCIYISSNGTWSDRDCEFLEGGICKAPCDDGWYLDNDGDGYGDPNLGTAGACGEPPPGAVAVAGDCDDTNPDANPGAIEICDDNGVDEDCDGFADELDPDNGVVWYALDSDGDGYGDDATAFPSCDPPGGDYIVSGDCDDSTAVISPDATTDLCNGIDDDCDGELDEECSCTGAAYDGDSYFFCEDNLAYLAAEEFCGSMNATLAFPEDVDEAGWMTTTADGIASQSWWIGLDDIESEGVFLTITDQVPGYTNWRSGEPNDANDNEDCAVQRFDGEWNDASCSGTKPFICKAACDTVYADFDGDGWGNDADSLTICGLPPALAAPLAGDCNDADATIRPSAIELCDDADIDENCDGLADDADDVALGKLTWFLDTDGDGFGDPDATIEACDLPLDAIDNDEDCDDTLNQVYPGAAEVCNDRDDDCNQRTDEGTTDSDGDGVCDELDPCPADAPDDINRDGICDSQFALQVVGMSPGNQAMVWLIQAPAVSNVYIGVSVSGPGSGPCAPTEDGGSVCAGIDNVIPLGRVTTDSAGNGWMQFTVPPTVDPGTTVWMQALSTADSGSTTPVVELVVQ